MPPKGVRDNHERNPGRQTGWAHLGSCLPRPRRFEQGSLLSSPSRVAAGGQHDVARTGAPEPPARQHESRQAGRQDCRGHRRQAEVLTPRLSRV